MGATVIFGTGSGIAFFMLMAHLSDDALFIGRTARVVVIADMVFTATAVIAQPITGYLLMRQTGLSFSVTWIAVSIVLYLIAGAFWLPVVWMQARMRDLALAAAECQNAPAAGLLPSFSPLVPVRLSRFRGGTCHTFPDDRQTGSITMPDSYIAILGASGLIGHTLAVDLRRRGFKARGYTRRFTAAQISALDEPAIQTQLLSLSDEGLARLLDDADIVVNTVGILQGSDIEAVHHAFATRLAACCAAGSKKLLIHISIPGDAKDDRTAYQPQQARRRARH